MKNKKYILLLLMITTMDCYILCINLYSVTQPEKAPQITTTPTVTPTATPTVTPTATPTVTPTATPTIHTSQPTEPAKKYRYIKGCPLSEKTQRGIFDICEKYSVSFEFVMAVIERESDFNPNTTGDNGNSKGLMQIQERWHSELMKELGVTNLYDPLQNVEVGVALLLSYFEKYDDVYIVLMTYNGGATYAKRMSAAGKCSEYALEIVSNASYYESERK